MGEPVTVNVKKGKGKKKANIIVPDKTGQGPSEEIQEAVATVVKHHKDGSMEETSEVVGAVHGKGPFANVGMVLARTFNLGNFENVKVSVSLHVPCPVDEQEIDDTYTFVSGWLDGKMNELAATVEAPSPDKPA